MALNVGYIEGTCGPSVVVRVYYDTAWLATDPSRDPGLAPLVNGPRGFCLDITNVTGRKSSLSVVDNSGGSSLTLAIQQGDPVTTGPQSGRSRTAAQMASLGYTTRGSVGNFAISCD